MNFIEETQTHTQTQTQTQNYYNFWNYGELYNYSYLFNLIDASLLENFLLIAEKTGRNNKVLEIIGKKNINNINIRQVFKKYFKNNYILSNSYEITEILSKINNNEELDIEELENFMNFVTSKLLVIKNILVATDSDSYSKTQYVSPLETDKFNDFMECVTTKTPFYVKTKNSNLITQIQPTTNIIIMTNEKLTFVNLQEHLDTIQLREDIENPFETNQIKYPIEFSYIEMKHINDPWHHLVISEYMEKNKLSNIQCLDLEAIKSLDGSNFTKDYIDELIKKYNYTIYPSKEHKYWVELNELNNSKTLSLVEPHECELPEIDDKNKNNDNDNDSISYSDDEASLFYSKYDD